MVLVKILTLSLNLFFFLIGLYILFDYIVDRKQGFLDYKNDIRRKSKIWHFSKGLTHGFGQNVNIVSQFVCFFFK